MTRLRSLALLCALASLPCSLVAQRTNKHAAKPTTAAITESDLMSRLYVFADDSMQGRETGTAGHMKATKYIAHELKKLGLKPAGDSGTYFQTVPFISRRISRKSTLAAARALLNVYADFVVLPFRGSFPRAIDGTVAVFGGVWGDSTNAITASQASGRLVVLIAPNGLGRIPANSPLSQAAGIVLVGGDALTPQQIAQARAPAYVAVPAAGAAATPATLLATRLAAETMLGAPIEGMAAGHLGNPISANLMYEITPAPTRNVVAILPGSDPALSGEYVAIGAHSDHIGLRAAGPLDHDSLHAFNAKRFFINDNPSGTPLTAAQRADHEARIAAIRINVDSLHRRHPARRDSINNGADDDGSGSVTLLEIAEAFAKGPVKPRRSLLFVWHTGEEKGLVGSRYFTDHPTVPRDSIVAQINLDMVGRGAATDLPGGGENYLQLVGSRRLSTELGDLTETVNRESAHPFTFDYAYDANGHPENIYCRSDHYNYARYGIPVVFLTTGLHGDYHQVTDEPQYIDYPHMAHVGRFVFTLVDRIADLDHRPVVDKPKPDPAGTCRQ